MYVDVLKSLTKKCYVDLQKLIRLLTVAVSTVKMDAVCL